MKDRIALTLTLAALFIPAALPAQDTPPNALLALSKKGHTLAIVDPASLKVLAKVPVGDDPHEVIASTDGKTAYVSNYGFGGSTPSPSSTCRPEASRHPSTSEPSSVPMASPLQAANSGSPPRSPKPSPATIPPRRKSTGSSAPARTAPT